MIEAIVKDRIVGIMSHGNSIEELEYNIEKYKDYNICWVSFNLFSIMEDFILNKINKKLEIILDCASSDFIGYELEIRIPRMLKIIKDNKLLISTWRLMKTEYDKYKLDFYNKYLNKIVLVDKLFGRLDGTPNTLFLLIAAIATGKPKKIILFGVDGSKEIPDKTFKGYYKPALQAEHRKRLVGNKPFTLHFTSNAFSDRFNKLYNDFCKRCKVKPAEIINCSPKSIFNIFRKISYNSLAKELQGEL